MTARLPADSGAKEWLTRAETSADITAIRDITIAAFPTSEEADIVDAMRLDPGWIDGLSVVSTDKDGRIVGHALLTRCHLDDAPALMLGPVSVRPEHQRTGAGSAVVRAVLERARLLGENHVVVVGHPEYYPRFGFTRASGNGISVGFEAPDEVVMAMTLDPLDPLPGGVVRFPAGFGL